MHSFVWRGEQFDKKLVKKIWLVFKSLFFLITNLKYFIKKIKAQSADLIWLQQWTLGMKQAVQKGCWII